MSSQTPTQTPIGERDRARSRPWWLAIWSGVRWLFSKRIFQVYLTLLVLSHLVIAIFDPTYPTLGANTPEGVSRQTVQVDAMGRDGPVAGEPSFAVSVLRWDPPVLDESKLPVLLLHGSPPAYAGLDFKWLAPRIASTGRVVYSIDRPGYAGSGKYPPSFSAKANARVALAAMEKLGVERYHVGGWSFGGAVAIWMGEYEPDTVASITMMAATGVQEGEGSGDYTFEHIKYTAGYGLLVVLPEFLPHFGLLGPRWFRHSFIRDFADTDQREISAIVPDFTIPTLILQGRSDFLVPAQTAELHHQLFPRSRLVILDGGHTSGIFPSGPDDPDMQVALRALDSFYTRHDQPGRIVLEGVADFAPVPPRKPTTIGGYEIDPGKTPWWALVLLIIVGTFISEDLTVIAVGLLLVTGQIDYGVALLGCFLGIVLGDYGLWALGRFGGTRLLRVPLFRRVVSEQQLEHWGRVLGRHTAKAVFLSRMLPGTRLPMYIAAGIVPGHNRKFLFWVTIAVGVWTPTLLILTGLIGPKLLGFFETIFHGPWAILAAFVVLVALLRIASLEATEIGRARLRAGIQRFVQPEFWPLWVFYSPLLVWLPMLALRHRSITVFTCANPGIPNGGGVVGEQKSRIVEGFANGGAPVLHAVVISPIDDDTLNDQEIARRRAQTLLDALADPASGLGSFPVVLKPDAGQRGFGVRIVENKERAIEYFEQAEGTVVAQRYDPGPCEYGVLWARNMDLATDAPMDERPGFIFSVTRKEFPVVEGDGESTLEQLIWKHPRYRMQGKVFQKRHEANRDLVLRKGEVYRLAKAGNHAQGTMFLDGADLITPELTEWAERAMQAYRDPGGRIDFGRMDVRCPSEEDFRAGRNISIIECNGTFSESTNMYDPKRSIGFMYRTLFRQWSLLYRIGAGRRRDGARPVGPIGLVRIWVSFRRSRSGPSLAD
jgi:membrane protein DedA with SNARE-associated domain/pimeloyl-ACP methyl ester carboxylesterase